MEHSHTDGHTVKDLHSHCRSILTALCCISTLHTNTHNSAHISHLNYSAPFLPLSRANKCFCECEVFLFVCNSLSHLQRASPAFSWQRFRQDRFHMEPDGLTVTQQISDNLTTFNTKRIKHRLCHRPVCGPAALSQSLRVLVLCANVFVLTSPVSDGADCPRTWLLMRTRLLTSPVADAPPTAPGPPKAPEGPCQASWLTPVCRLLDRGSSCLPVEGWRRKWPQHVCVRITTSSDGLCLVTHSRSGTQWSETQSFYCLLDYKSHWDGSCGHSAGEKVFSTGNLESTAGKCFCAEDSECWKLWASRISLENRWLWTQRLHRLFQQGLILPGLGHHFTPGAF